MNLKSKLIVTAAGGYAAIQLARHFVRRSREFAWRDKRVVVTGGSRGLGLVIARQLAPQGARLAICARSAGDLQEAATELRESGAEVVSAASAR